MFTWVPSAGPGCCWQCAGQRCPGPRGPHSPVGETQMSVQLHLRVRISKRRDLEVVAGSKWVGGKIQEGLGKVNELDMKIEKKLAK